MFSRQFTELTDEIKRLEKSISIEQNEFLKIIFNRELTKMKNNLSLFKYDKLIITIYKNNYKYYISEILHDFHIGKNNHIIDNTFQMMNNTYNKDGDYIRYKNSVRHFQINALFGYPYVVHGEELPVHMNNNETRKQLDQLKQYYIFEEQEIIFDTEDLQNKCKDLLETVNELKNDSKDLKDKYENLLMVTDELKCDLNQKNNKIRDLEVKIHYLEMNNVGKKVKYDYLALKQKNKVLHSEFKRIYKLTKFS